MTSGRKRDWTPWSESSVAWQLVPTFWHCLIRHITMLNLHDGVLTLRPGFDSEGPALKCSEFLPMVNYRVMKAYHRTQPGTRRWPS